MLYMDITFNSFYFSISLLCLFIFLSQFKFQFKSKFSFKNVIFFRLNSNISLQLPVTTHHTHLLQVKISEISYSEFLAGQF